MCFSSLPGKLRLHRYFYLALAAVIGLSTVSAPAKCTAQTLQQAQERLREEIERQREQLQERQREAEERQQEAAREREQQQEQERQREQQERQQEAAREREQQLEQERQAERQREQQERQEQAERERQQQAQERQAQLERQQQEQERQAERERRQRPIETVQPVPFTPLGNRATQPSVQTQPDFRFRPVPTAPVQMPVLTNHPPFGLPIAPRPPVIGVSPAITIVVPGPANTLNASQGNVVLQEILSTQAAEVQAVTNGIDQIMLALIQNSSNPELARAMLDRMSQPDPMPQTLNEQMVGFSAISQANANRSCSMACSNSPDVQRLSAQCNSGSQAACYQAAASLCQCNLSNGGCGSDVNQLQACVQQNTQAANSLLSTPGALNPSASGPGSQPVNTTGSKNPETSSSNCSPNWSACPAD